MGLSQFTSSSTVNLQREQNQLCKAGDPFPNPVLERPFILCPQLLDWVGEKMDGEFSKKHQLLGRSDFEETVKHNCISRGTARGRMHGVKSERVVCRFVCFAWLLPSKVHSVQTALSAVLAKRPYKRGEPITWENSRLVVRQSQTIIMYIFSQWADVILFVYYMIPSSS